MLLFLFVCFFTGKTEKKTCEFFTYLLHCNNHKSLIGNRYWNYLVWLSRHTVASWFPFMIWDTVPNTFLDNDQLRRLCIVVIYNSGTSSFMFWSEPSKVLLVLWKPSTFVTVIPICVYSCKGPWHSCFI